MLAGRVADVEGVARHPPSLEPSRALVALMIAIAFAVYITVLGVGHGAPPGAEAAVPAAVEIRAPALSR